MTNERIFSRRAATILAGVGGLGLAVSLFFMIFSDVPAEVDSAGTNTFSRSALGHRALVELLENDVPLLVSRQSSAAKASPTTPILVLEPPVNVSRQIERLTRFVNAVRARGAKLVLVLPKWRGTPQSGRREWVARIDLEPLRYPGQVLAAVLDTVGEKGHVRRLRQPPDPWHGELAESAKVRIERPQVVRAEGLVTVLGSDEGALVARTSDAGLWIVADPDLLNTAGLAHGGNAVFVHRLLIGLLEPKALVIDEVLHGFGRKRSIWNVLLRFPLAAITLHLTVLTALGLWATTTRFGQPLNPPSRLPPGKLTLVDNTARLLALGGDVKESLDRYLELVVRRTARRLALPPVASSQQEVARLSRLAARRGVGEDLEQLAASIKQMPRHRPDPPRALELARALDRWHKELHHGTRTHPGPR